ncbi:hypothetical protein ABBQ38_002703 [Trebouxia sp. C0009 RCD-2024]
MPPKKGAAKGGGKGDKTKQAAKAKAIEDKTFGLKNKSKSAKVQGYVQQLQKSAQVNSQNKQNDDKKDKKKAEADRQKELNDLFAIAIKQPKVPPGVDPKSIVCEYFRAGQCTKGFKCKFSHDLAVERKGGKIDLFTDTRNDEDDMDEWDQEELERVVKQKHGAEASNKTDIICKFFLEAVEKKQYGWFWQCPNGGKDCKYRHALPPGYVLKSQMKELLELEAKNAISIEEEIENERKKVDAKTPITEEVFSKWKHEKREVVRRQQEEAIAERKRKGILSGREIFAQVCVPLPVEYPILPSDRLCLYCLVLVRCQACCVVNLVSLLGHLMVCWAAQVSVRHKQHLIATLHAPELEESCRIEQIGL